MSTPQEKMLAFQSAQKFGKQFPGLLEALAEWANIGSLEQAADETQRRLDAMRAEEETLASALKTKAADADAIASKLAAQSERELANRRAVAAAIVDEANLEARCILDAARVKAAELLQDAERRAAEHQALVAATKQELAKITAAIEAKTGELSSVTAAVVEKHAQHERFTRLIGELTAKL
jgi:DNA repair exonuclease SbcCD ATPase subunit